MKTHRALIFVLAASALASAQTKNPVSSALREILPRQQKNLVAAAEEMPAEKYGYKPTEAQITFGHLILHVAQTNQHLCAKISDATEPKPIDVKDTDSKEKIVEALKGSFDFCGSALAKVDDSKLGDTVELFGGHTGPRAAAMFIISNDWADHYSAAAMYLRLNGMLPPTAQKK